MRMLASKKSWLGLFVLMIAAVFTLTNCVPTEQVSQEEMLALQKARRDSIRKANYNKCAFKLSNGNQYKIQENWTQALDNYKGVLTLGCAEDFVNPLYEDMAWCYYKLGQTDSAAWAVDEGLIYLPGDKHLLELLAYYYRNDVEKSIQTYIRINSLFPGNVDYMFKLADYYNVAGRFDEQVEMLENILEIEADNTKAEQSIVQAYEASGRDPIERIASLYQANKMDAQYGYRYGKMLFERGDFATAMIVLEEAVGYNPSNRLLVELLGQVYELENKVDKATVLYVDLATKNGTDVNLLIKVSELFKNQFNFQEAMKWAEKAAATSGNDAKSLECRGEVYLAIADACSAAKPKVDFNDKLVFHMAYEDFQDAKTKGNNGVAAKMKYLKDNELIIASQKDYFLAKDANRVGNKVYKPLGDCYSWITRTVTVQ